MQTVPCCLVNRMPHAVQCDNGAAQGGTSYTPHVCALLFELSRWHGGGWLGKRCAPSARACVPPVALQQGITRHMSVPCVKRRTSLRASGTLLIRAISAVRLDVAITNWTRAMKSAVPISSWTTPILAEGPRFLRNRAMYGKRPGHRTMAAAATAWRSR